MSLKKEPICTKEFEMSNVLKICVLCFCIGCNRPWFSAPGAITDTELNAMELPFQIGNRVRVMTGPHKGQQGTVEGISGFTGSILYIVKMENSTSTFTEKCLLNCSKRAEPPETNYGPFLPDKKIGG